MKVFTAISRWVGLVFDAQARKDKAMQLSVRLMFTVLLGLGWVQASDAQVEISEFIASNDETLSDEDGDFSDWIELHNTSGSAVNLSGWYLTDDDQELDLWQFPSTTLNAGEYLVVFASDKDRAVSGSELHTNFKLKSSGEYLALVQPDGVTVISDYAPEYPDQFEDISFGGNTYYVDPTPGSANGSGVFGFADPVEFDLEHGVYDSPQVLALSTNLPAGEIRYTLDGSVPSNQLGCTPPTDGKAWSYDYYEGTWSNLPDFDILTPVASGTADTISTDPRQQENNFGLRFTGCIQALASGFYTFETTSDDGDQLYIDGVLVIDNSGPHVVTTASQEVYLEKGLHTVKVDYFQQTGTHLLAVDWSAPLRGATYSATPNFGNIYSASPLNANFVEFDVDVPADGDFEIIARVRGVDTNSDSFWVQLDGQSFWQFNTGVSAGMQDVELNNAGSVIKPALTAGEHKLRFYVREDGAQIDFLTVQKINCDGPCETQVLQAEIEESSGLFALGGLDKESLPGHAWFTYSSPLQLTETSTIRSVAVQNGYIPSNVATSTYLFLDDVVLQSRAEQAPDGWPAGNINGQDMDYGMDPDIVDPDPAAVKASLNSLPTISIVTDVDNLMHPDFGIYVNALEKGRNWERPASIELIDPSGNEDGFTIDAGIRIRGGFSRQDANPKHPFRLYFRGDYGGDLDYPLFGDEGVDEFKRIDLRSPNNYSWAFSNSNRNTLLREVWSRDMQKALGRPYTRSRYYHMYINGQYWGITMTQERVTKHFADDYFGGKEKDYDVVKHNRQDGFRYEASDGFNAAWNDVWDLVADETIDAADYAALEQLVDIDNLIDYVLGNGFEGDIDGATSWFISRWKRANNWYAVRNREGSGDALKWSFFQHDGEHTLGARRDPSAELNVLGPHAPFNGQNNEFFSKDFMNPYWIHGALTSNSDYRQRVIDRAAVLFAEAGVLSNEQGLVRWNAREDQVRDAILAHSARWGDSKRSTPYTENDWANEVAYVENTFFADRSEIVFAQLVALGLASDIPVPEFSIETGTEVEPETVVFIQNNSTGTVYYTTDGSDPRAPGGGISANAIALMPGQGIQIDADVVITIRVLDGSEWSAPVTAEYTVPVEEESCFVVPTKNQKVVVFCL